MERTPARAARFPWLVVACLAAVYIVWGTTFFGIKVAVQSMPPFFLVGTRYLAAGGLLAGWQLARDRSLPSARQWRSSVVLAILMLVVGNGCAALAERHIGSGAAVALGSVMPLTVALWSGLFGQWPRRADWIAIALGAAGAALMASGNDLSVSLTGTLLILFGTVSWSLGMVLSRRLNVSGGASGFAAEMLCAGAIALTLSAALGEHWSLGYGTRTFMAWGYLVVFGSLIGFSAFRYLIDNVSPMLASTYAYANPVVALIVGAWLGGERFSVQLFLGLPVVLAAVGLLAFTRSRELTAGTARLARAPQSASRAKALPVQVGE